MDLSDMLEKLAAGTATAEDEQAFGEWIATLPAAQFREVLAAYEEKVLVQPPQAFEPFNAAQLAQLLEETRPRVVPMYRRGWVKYAVAAVFACVVVGTAWLYIGHQKPQPGQTAVAVHDVAPGRYGAILRLADSSTIVLDSTGNGQIATGIIKADSSLLTYRKSNLPVHNTVAYNILTTPKGRQFQVELEDGTKVWLNAGSSLTYPIAFIGSTREVALTGEAYFEVAKNPVKPFYVHAGSADIRVLGTHFNVMAYTDEPNIEATLLEGLVQASKGGEQKIITPGQLAIISNNNTTIRVAEADTDKVMAWKSGFFQFDQTDMAAMLRQLSRWYDVEVRYEGAVPNRKFFGRINRNMNLSAVLQILQANNIHFKIEGNTLIVTP